LTLGIFLAIVRLGANPVIATAVWHSPELPAEAVFIPLMAGWAIWICLAISARASDIRVAQQLGILSSLPPAALTALMSFQVINPTFTIAASLAGALLVIDCGAYLLVSRLFDRERLVTGTRPAAPAPAPRSKNRVRSRREHYDHNTEAVAEMGRGYRSQPGVPDRD